MLRSQFLGGSVYFDTTVSGGLNHQMNARHGSLFVYKTIIGGNTQGTLPPTDFLPHRSGFMWMVLNLGPGTMFLKAQGSIQPLFEVPCQMMAMVYMLHQDGRNDKGEQDASWRVKLMPLRGATVFTCEGDTVSTPSSPSSPTGTGGSGSGSGGSGSGSDSPSPSGSESCHASLESLCLAGPTPSSDGDT